MSGGLDSLGSRWTACLGAGRVDEAVALRGIVGLQSGERGRTDTFRFRPLAALRRGRVRMRRRYRGSASKEERRKQIFSWGGRSGRPSLWHEPCPGLKFGRGFLRNRSFLLNTETFRVGCMCVNIMVMVKSVRRARWPSGYYHSGDRFRIPFAKALLEYSVAFPR